ncbi:MAG: sigma-54-dependent Fis family transcriptional regulator, partial [Candidatus Marinimicrobia bacterium]|nr:sigma-54-dependent Fis family transcriptional regulator [Candidatus Neomarinimicrobiota bacterium]
FREDLYYRLNIVTINIPPLKERREDIPLLANYFFQKFTVANAKKITGISGEAMMALIDYDWPGNVRELENAIERAVVVSKKKEIIIDDLPETISVKAEVIESEPRSLNEFEKKQILQVLNENDWNISKSAKELKIDRGTLYNKLKKYNIKR